MATQQINPYTAFQDPGISYQNESDPRKLAANQRSMIQQRGDQLESENEALGQQASDQTQGYTSFLDPIEQQMASGQGGYTADEASQIQDQGGLNQISGELPGNYLTPGEQSGMMGDTSSYTNYFDPNSMNSELNAQQSTATGIAQGMQQNLDSSIDPSQLTQSQQYQQNVQTGENQFGDAKSALYNGEAQNVRGAISSAAPSLVQSGSAAQTEVMTPEQENEIVQAAGISAGTQNQAAVGTLQRQALAAGASPQGVAAYRARMNQQSAIQGADAMTQARVQAQQARAGEALSSEQQRLGAQQYLSGQQIGTEEQMGEQAVNLENQVGQEELAQANAQEQNRQQAQQYLTGAELQAATTGGEAQLQNAQTSTGQTQAQNEYNASTGTGIAEAQDTANANRAAAVAQNRQQTGMANENTQLNLSNAQSGRATTVGNTRLNQQNTGLGLQSGEQQMYNANAQGAYGRQVQNYGVQSQGTNQAANIGFQASQTPTTADKVIGGVGGALGAAASFLEDGEVATEPTLAVVGEHGPEKVVNVGHPNATQPYRARATVKQMAPPKKPGRRVYGEAA